MWRWVGYLRTCFGTMLYMPAIAYLILGGSVLTIGDIVFKSYALMPKMSLYISGLVIYMGGLMLLVQSFKTENMAVASAVFVMINVLTLSIISWLYFGEKLSLLQILGIVLSFVAIGLLELGK